MLATGLQVQFVDAPVLQIITKRQHAHLVHDVQLAGAVEVQDRAEAFRVAVEEVLVVRQRVVVAQLHDGLVGGALPQPPEPRVGQPLQGPPEDLVPHAAHVDADAAVQLLRLGYHERLGRRYGGHGSGMCPLQGAGGVALLCDAADNRLGASTTDAPSPTATAAAATTAASTAGLSLLGSCGIRIRVRW